MHTIFYKLIYKVGEFLYTPLIKKAEKELLSSDYSTESDLLELQNRRLSKLLTYAVNNNSFYRDKYKNIQFEKVTVDNISILPILTKDELRENYTNIQMKYLDEKHFSSETSGSSGEPLIFNRNESWVASHRAAQIRGYSWYGVKWWDKNIYFWGFDPSFIKKIQMRFVDFFLNRYRIFSFDANTLEKSLVQIKKSKYIEGYSSCIFQLSKYLNDNSIQINTLSLVKGTSEKIYPNYKALSEKVFNTTMVSEYGAAEAGIIAFECPEGTMHVTMENVIVEEVNGKIIVTNLHSFSLPIIRYDLGDYIELDKEHDCACGRKHHAIKDIRGRVGIDIVGLKQNYPSLVLYYIFKNIALASSLQISYFGKQFEAGILILEVCEVEHLSKEELRNIILIESHKYFKKDVSVEVRIKKDEESKLKKEKDFESYIVSIPSIEAEKIMSSIKND